MEAPFKVFDLSTASVGSEMLPRLANGIEYLPLHNFVELLKAIPESVEPRTLSMGASVVADPMECYLSSEYVASSQLKQALNSERHFLLSREPNEDEERANHFELGTFIHEAILEPARFEMVKVEPSAKRNTIEGLRTLVDFYASLVGGEMSPDGDKKDKLTARLEALTKDVRSRGIEVVTAANYEVIKAIRKSITEYADGVIPRIMSIAQVETSMYLADEEHDLNVRIRPDGILSEENFGANVIISVKTTSSGSLTAFMRDCVKHRYALAEGMYLEVASKVTGRNFGGTLMIMAQTVKPYNVAAIYWTREDLDAGIEEYHRAIPIAREVLLTGKARGYEALAADGDLGIIESFLPIKKY